ncbi:MAG: hypothetical protein HYZ51_03565 [Candidatus Doudnabacteria bacterium]|nr:hypothetical protein [Candidatus Doudnabacteria bacterium]
MKSKNLAFILRFVFSGGLLFSGFLFAQAQESTITFPVAELGNCSSKQECKAYCRKEENFESCTDFAEKHNLLPKDAKNKKQILKEILKNKGPGGCDSHEACQAYCENEEHQEECLEFGKKHGLISKEDEERANRFLPLMKQGLTPGGCKSKTVCEAYCQEAEHQQECIDFAVKIGAMSKEQAEKAKKFNGRGPGGCTGKQECEEFCNNPGNQEVCFQFAKDNGFIKEEDIKRMKEGMGQMRMGLQNAPEEVKECLRQTVDEGVLSGMETGEFAPTAETGQSIRECFEKFRPQMEEHRRQEFKANPEIEECLKAAVGEEVLSQVKTGQAPPSPELAEKVRGCFEQFGGQRRGQGPDGESSEQRNQMMADCVRRKLGDEAGEKALKQGLEQTEKVKVVIKGCQEEFSASRRRKEDGDEQGLKRAMQLSPEVKQCVVEKAGEDIFAKMEADELPEKEGQYMEVMQECMRLRMKDGGQYQKSDGQRPPEKLGRPMMDNSNQDNQDYPQYQYQYQKPPEGQYPSQTFPNPQQNFGSNPPLPIDPSVMENCKKQVLGDQPQEFSEELRMKLEACIRAASGQVQGSSTSRLPGFIRWLLGIGR